MPLSLENTTDNDWNSVRRNFLDIVIGWERDVVSPSATTLPTVAPNGYSIYYQTAAMKTIDAGPWLMRYDSSITDAYKWTCIGSASNPMEHESIANEGAIGTTPTNLVPEIQLPLAGIWYVEVYTRHGGPETASHHGYLGYKIGAAEMDDQDSAQQRATATADNDFGPMRFLRKKTITTAALLKMRAKSSSGNFYPSGNGAIAHGLRAWPVRVQGT